MKLFKYELHRILCNKFFAGLLVITFLYSYQVMAGEIVLGTANTAPFSEWSFGMYLSRMLPILLITLLFFVSFFYSRQEQEVRRITDTTPMDQKQLGLLRCSAMMVGFVCISVVSVGVGLWFYAVNFQYTDFSHFLLPGLLTLIPAMLFFLGIGIMIGKIHPALIYALMPLVFLLGYLPIPNAFDLFGSSFFQKMPLSLPIGTGGEPAFTVPFSVWIGKAIYTALGLFLIILGLTRKSGNRSIYKAKAGI
jgi:ABC-2 type transport system permease protein